MFVVVMVGSYFQIVFNISLYFLLLCIDKWAVEGGQCRRLWKLQR